MVLVVKCLQDGAVWCGDSVEATRRDCDYDRDGERQWLRPCRRDGLGGAQRSGFAMVSA